MEKFKVGDLIIGRPESKNMYVYTTNESIMQVVNGDDEHNIMNPDLIAVKVIKSCVPGSEGIINSGTVLYVDPTVFKKFH